MTIKYKKYRFFTRHKIIWPLLTGIVLFVLTLTRCWIIYERDLLDIQKMTKTKAEESISDIDTDLQDRTSSISRLARRWTMSGGTPKEAFIDEVLQRKKDYPGLVIVQRVDSRNQPLWIVPNTAQSLMKTLIETSVPHYETSLQQVELNRKLLISPVISFRDGEKGMIVYTPLIAHQRYDGCVVEVINFPLWFRSLFINNKYAGDRDYEYFKITVYMDGVKIYEQGEHHSVSDNKALSANSQIVLFGHQFNVIAQPTSLFINSNRSMLPQITLILGALFSILIAAIVLLLQITIDQTRKLRLSEQKYIKQANYDVLTGLPSRRLAEDMLSLITANAARQQQCVAVMFMDLDGFKLINDTYGHHMGDLVLREVAKRLASSVRKSDTVARLGGDEFLIILPDIKNRECANVVAGKILQKLTQPIELLSEKISISASIGIACYPNDGDNPLMLLEAADAGMYTIKKKSKIL